MEPIPLEITDEIDRRILEKLREMEKREGDSSRFAKIYGELFHIQMEARLHAGVTRPILEKHLIENRLRQGIPLLLLGDFQPDWNQAHTVFKKILAWAAKDSEVSPKFLETWALNLIF